MVNDKALLLLFRKNPNQRAKEDFDLMIALSSQNHSSEETVAILPVIKLVEVIGVDTITQENSAAPIMVYLPNTKTSLLSSQIMFQEETPSLNFVSSTTRFQVWYNDTYA